MNFKYTHRTSLAAILLAGFLAPAITGCSDDMASDTPDASGNTAAGQIVICGAGSEAAITSRAAEPDILDPNVCSADMLIIDSYHYSTGLIKPAFDAKNLAHDSQNITYSLRRTGLNKVTNHDFSFSYNPIGYHFFALRALACTQDEYESGEFQYACDGNLTQSHIRLNVTEFNNAGESDTEGVQTSTTLAFHVPELFYGPLTTDLKNVVASISESEHNAAENYYSFRGLASSTSGTLTCSGILYRIVGQINLTLTDVPESFTEAELLCSNLPVKLPLYSDAAHRHADNYPVGIADETTSADGSDVWTVVDEKPWGSTLKLSTFMLPNETGCELRLRITDKSGKVSRYDIRPSASVFLNDTDNIYKNVSDAIKSAANQYYIYNSLNFKFYAFSNVRVNIRAEFDKVADNPVVVVTGIEVEPAFETKHNFNITQ